MKSKQLSIFVSSTFVDLADTRANILKFLGVLDSDLVSMEVFGSDESSSKSVCLTSVAASNFFIGIYAMRYGSIDAESGCSLTELEYHLAHEMLQAGKLKGLLLYTLDPEALWPVKYIDRHAEGIEKLATFKELIAQRHTITFFKDSAELPFDILKDTIRKLELGTNKVLSPRESIQVQSKEKLERPIGMEFFSQSLSKLFYGRSHEINELKGQIIRHQFSLLIGVSGMGKTSLLNAGIIPEMELLGWLCCLTRPLDSPIENLRKTIWNQLMQGSLPSQFGLDDIIRTVLEVSGGKKVLIVIDQFDDVLNTSGSGEIAAMVAALNLLFSLKDPRLHILISYRGDVESEIGIIWQKISGAADGLPRYYLSPLDKQNAGEILISTLNNLGIILEPASTLGRILDDIETESKKNGHHGIFPPFVQMLISTMFEHLQGHSFSMESYQRLSGSQGIISGFLYNQLDYLGAEKTQGIQFLISLVNNYGAKTQKTPQEITSESGLGFDEVQSIATKLLDLRLIRYLDNSYEITHDLLAMSILKGLMTDEEKDIRRFKFLLESKAHAFDTTMSALTYAEYVMIYKYREKLSISEIELKLLVISSVRTDLPISYWLTAENLHLINDEIAGKLLRSYNTNQVHLGLLLYPSAEGAREEIQWSNIQEKPLAILSLGSKEDRVMSFYDRARENLEYSSMTEYRLGDKAKYKKLLAGIAISKFGSPDDLGQLSEWIEDVDLDGKQRYVGMRSIIFMSKRLGIPLQKQLLLNYGGTYWPSIFTDLDEMSLPKITLGNIFELIELHEENAPYLDYLVRLLKRIIRANDYSKVLAFIEKRFLVFNKEVFLDKYLVTALDICSDYTYFISLIRNSVNTIHVGFKSLIHEKIGKLGPYKDYDQIRSLVGSKAFYDGEHYQRTLEKQEITNLNNWYLYVWVMGVRYCHLARREDMATLVSLLRHSFFTIRHAALLTISKIGEKEDLRYFLDAGRDVDKYREFPACMFLLDCKVNLSAESLSALQKMEKQKKHEIYGGVNYPLLAKVAGSALDPYKNPMRFDTPTYYSAFHEIGQEDDLPF